MGPDAISNIYASDIISGFDLHKPEKMNVLFNKRGDQGASMFQLIRSMGFEQPVASDTYGHFEDLDIHEIVHVRTNVAQPLAGEPVVFVLGTEDLDANHNFYLRVGDNILFHNEVTGTVTAIDVTDPDAPSVTVEPQESLDQIPALTDGDELVIHSAAFAEGSGQPAGAVSGTWEYSNTAQIIKETIGVTGTEMVNQSWVTVTSMGQQLMGYYMKGQIDIDYRMALKIDGALMWNKHTTNTGIVDNSTEGGGRLRKTTEGLIPYCRRIGNEQACTAGAFDVDEFDEMDRTLTREFAGNYILGLLGAKIHQDIENALVTYFANSNIVYAKQTTNDVLFKSNESLGASVNFAYLTKSERTYLFKRMGIFSNKKLAGAAGYNAENLGIFMPINAKKDPKSGNMVDSIGTRYRALGPYSRRMEVWKDGAAGNGLKIGDIDKQFTYQRCHVGAHFRGGNQFVLLEAS
jgi:hypothetical protein